MNKKTILLIAAILFVSCNKDKEADIQYQFTASVDVSEMFKGIKDGDRNDRYTNKSKDYLVTINCLVYDETGKLIHRDKNESLSLFGKVSFSVPLNEGNYTVVAWAWVKPVLSTGIISWVSANENFFNSLKIVSNNIDPAGAPILGVNKTGITVNKATDKNIVVRPVGACYMLNFIFPPETKTDYIRLNGNMLNQEYFVDREVASVTVSSTNSLWWREANIVAYEKSQLWDVPVFFLPATQQNFELIWETFSGEELINTYKWAFSSVEQGKYKLIDINTETGDVAVTPTNE